MGGSNGGRYGDRPTVESGLTLDLYRLIRQKLFQAGHRSGSITWTHVRTGNRAGQVGYHALMNDEDGCVRLHYITTNAYSGEKHSSEYTIGLQTTPQPFGGRRWWFVCPRSGDLVAKLHLPNGAHTFASRKAHRLGYRSQREGPRDRARSRAQDLRYKLGGSMNLMDPIPPKPKWMHWRTYDRRVAKIEAADHISNIYLWSFVQSLQRKREVRHK
jgi:hypothetical protein